jgi:hypothetical protein
MRRFVARASWMGYWLGRKLRVKWFPCIVIEWGSIPNRRRRGNKIDRMLAHKPVEMARANLIRNVGLWVKRPRGFETCCNCRWLDHSYRYDQEPDHLPIRQERPGMHDLQDILLRSMAILVACRPQNTSTSDHAPFLDGPCRLLWGRWRSSKVRLVAV